MSITHRAATIPIGAYPARVDDLAREYAAGPDEWDVEHDGDGEIDDVDLEVMAADEESL